MKWSSSQFKIGLMDITLLIVLNIIIPTGDVFTDLKASATFFFTGRNCHYKETEGARNWTYSQCKILPTLRPTNINIPGSDGTTGLASSTLEPVGAITPATSTLEPVGAITPATSTQKGIVFAGPTKLVYVNYARIHTDKGSRFKYAIDAVISEGWQSLFKFWAFKEPVSGSIPIYIGVDEKNWKFQVQKEKWTPSADWKLRPQLERHVMTEPGEGRKMYTVSQSVDGSSRILDRDCVGEENPEEWKIAFTFFAKEEVGEKSVPLPLKCSCDTIAILSSGNSATWRTEYLGKYEKETVSGDAPCNYIVKKQQYVQKPTGRSILKTDGGKWFVGINTDEGFNKFAESKGSEAVDCPSKAEMWTYSTDTQGACDDETLKAICIKKDEVLSDGDEECQQGLDDGTVEFKCDEKSKPYRYFGWLVIIPTILTTLVTLKVWWETEETATNRLLTLPLLLLQLWPQYRAVLIIIHGLNSNDKWKLLQEKHNKEIASIEPMYESVIQVNVTGSILFTTAGPWYDNINSLYNYPLAGSLWSYFISLFTASFGIAKFLLVGPVRILPDGLLHGLLSWTFLSAFVATLSTVFLKAFWLAVIIKRHAFYQNVDCVWNLTQVNFWEITNAIAIGVYVYYLPNIFMALVTVIAGFGMRKSVSIISRIPVLVLIPAFSPFTFGFYYQRSRYLSFSRSLTFMNTIIIILQIFIPPYAFIYNENEHWFYTTDFTLYTYHTVLVSSMVVCLPLVVIPTLLLIVPRLPGCKPHLNIRTLNIDTWQNEEQTEDSVLSGNTCDNSAFEFKF